jgi:hypothetical protein
MADDAAHITNGSCHLGKSAPSIYFSRHTRPTEETPMQIEGRCHCGKIAYRASVDPDAVGICHCTDCQTLSGSPYRATIRAPAESFALLSGEPKIYIKTAESGTKRAHAFCPDCGTPLYAAAVSSTPNYSLRVGAIKQRAALRPARQIWCRSALPWSMDIEAIDKVDRQ